MFPARVVCLSAFLLSVLSTAFGQDYPSKPVTMVNPFPPGGVDDIVGRPLAGLMEKTLKQPVIFVNRTGAGGAVGMGYVAHSAPDGYTILMGLSSISVFPVADRVNGKTPGFELSDLAPIALITADPTVLVVRADGPYKSVKDLVDAAKANPGKINYSSSGVYGALHVAMEIFTDAAGIKLFHIPYQGGGPAVAALLGGQVEASPQGPAAAIGQIKAGKFRPLASWGTERHPLMPDVPTFKELGYDAEFYIWSAVFAPAATPPEILLKLRSAVKQAATSLEFKAAMDRVSTPVHYLDAPEFKKYWDTDAARLKTVVEKIGPVEAKEKK
jgi:tripartite-type tricarboxylate transporter receptor subunit TctC